MRLKSAHVARVLDVGAQDDGAPYLVMELLEGCDLATLLEERGPLPIPEAVAYVLQACEALAEAHGLGVVHRDLKPRNLFVTTDVDGAPFVKVLDFGISKLVADAGSTQDLALTRTTDVMGSPSYMAPEQLRSARNADHRSDIWSLGVVLFELTTGRMPFEAQSVTELGAMIMRDPPRPIRELLSATPSGFESVILRCLEKEPAARFASVEELAQALEPFAGGLAAGAAARITSVARASKRPPERPSFADRASSSSRVVVSGGTSVSWGETEQMPGVAPARVRSRRLAVAAAGLVGAGLLIGGVVLAVRPPPAPAPVASAPASPEPSPKVAAAGQDVAPAEAPPPPTGLAAIASPAPPPASAPSPAVPSARPAKGVRQTRQSDAAPAVAPSASAPAPKVPDPHDLRSIDRK